MSCVKSIYIYTRLPAVVVQLSGCHAWRFEACIASFLTGWLKTLVFTNHLSVCAGRHPLQACTPSLKVLRCHAMNDDVLKVTYKSVVLAKLL